MDIIEHLATFGYAIEKNVISSEECMKMAEVLDSLKSKQEKKGASYDSESQSVIFNIHLQEPDIFLDKISIPKVMGTLSKIFNHQFILSNFNGSLAGKKGGNRVHIDSRIPIANFKNTFQVAVLFCIDDFTPQNGSTIVWPFSHKSDQDPRNLRDNTAFPGSIIASAPKGSVIYTLGQTWHDIGANLDDSRRWGIIAYYTRWWIKPTFDFTKCGNVIYERLSSQQKSLMGFTSRPPTPKDNRHHTVIPVEDLPDNYEDL